jgi:hypothetical protein
MCARCRRRLLVGERFRFWQGRDSAHPRMLCTLCERDAPHEGWIPAARDPGREVGSGRAVRRVA